MLPQTRAAKERQRTKAEVGRAATVRLRSKPLDGVGADELLRVAENTTPPPSTARRIPMMPRIIYSPECGTPMPGVLWQSGSRIPPESRGD